MTWARILEQWTLIEADFRSEYGVRLASVKVRRRMPWREFRSLVRGLLMSETRLWRALKPEGDADGGGGSHDGGFDQREADVGFVGLHGEVGGG